jgi:WD40 repeat protein
VAYSPDGRTLASASQDNTVRLWDVTDHTQLAILRHTDSVQDVAFSPDGRTLVSASNDGTVRLWDVSHRVQSAVLSIRTGVRQALAVAFSPDQRILAARGSDGMIHLWDVARQMYLGVVSGGVVAVEQSATLPTNPLLTGDYVYGPDSIAFTPDGRALASASRDDSIKIWDVTPESWRHHLCEIAGRSLTEAEWAQFVPNIGYQRTCEALR